MSSDQCGSAARSRGFSISTKLAIAFAGVSAVVIAALFVVLSREYASDIKHTLIEQAEVFTALADETKNHTAKMHADGAFKSEELLTEAMELVNRGGKYEDSRFFKTIPVVAGWMAAGEAAEKEGLEFHVPAFDARNPKNLPEKGTFRDQLLRDLTDEYESKGVGQLARVDEQTNQLHYMRAIKLDASCMSCHGDPAKYDTKDAEGRYDGKDALGFKMEGWQPGDMHGAFEIVIPLAKMDSQIAGFYTIGLAVSVPIIVLGCAGFMWYMRRSVGKPLGMLVDRMADCNDLTKRVNIRSRDEIGRVADSFNDFTAKLRGMMNDVTATTSNVAAAATEISASAEEMASGLRSQQEQTSQVSAAISQMTGSISEVASMSGRASEAARSSGARATTGGEVVGRTVTEMNGIADVVTRSASSVGALGKKSEQIGQIIGVIDDIADQTNLLALNAAIEAARAGEHGRGFAVVADEVRKLAERTTSATEQVASSIREIQTETQSVVTMIGTSADQVRRGVEFASEAGRSLGEIVSASGNVQEMVASIAAAAQEQSAASDQITRSVESINSVANESAQGAGQAAQAAAKLSEEAERLRELVSQFKV